MPVGLGTLGISPSEASTVINEALSLGYRLFDCAPVYFNEKEIGDAFHESTSGVPRTDVFITSKLASPFHRPEHVEPALRKTLNEFNFQMRQPTYSIDSLVNRRLQRLAYWVSGFVPHPLASRELCSVFTARAFKYVEFDPSARGWPDEEYAEIDESEGGARIDPSVSIRDTWTAMERLVDKGLVKYIGVANFPVMLLHDLLSYARIPPVVNQVEIHPYNQQSKLLSYCKSRNVAVQAYSPLGLPSYKETGEPDLLLDPVLKEIAAAHGVTVAQVCLQWSLQRGYHVIVKSSKRNHLEENQLVNHKNEFASNPIRLTSEEMDRIASLDRNLRFTRPDDWWKDMPVFN
ncbi:LOW QUALITY PROTEIN: hypothetical protein HJC23_012587 [Cyclotella cryptica]|uniref:NADP-dependent oxidoreductase domain-containing protein n=1 Tax=Cyclotella cryptica TaxID=29204 RepID=A0ABD3NYR0_9STRA